VHYNLLYVINSWIWIGYMLYLLLRSEVISSDYQQYTLKMAFHNIICIFPYVMVALCFRAHDHESIVGFLTLNLWAAVFIIYSEVVFTWTYGLPDFPGGLYGLSFLCCMAVFFLARFLAFIPTSRIPFLSHAWRRLKATLGRIRRAGRKVWMYLAGVVREV